MPTRFLPFFLLATATALAAPLPSSTPPPAGAPPTVVPVTVLDPVAVTAQLDQARETILPNLGATSFYLDQQQIENQPLGDNASFSQVLLRAPGVAEDSAANGDLHVRGEHANLQYRINGVLLPEGISGFGLELDPRFVRSLQLITGSLPAQYGFRTAGIVDLQTKSGAFHPGGDVSVSGGSFDTIQPSFETGGSSGSWSYFADGGYEHSDLGIENPTASAAAIHDGTDQEKAFVDLSRILDPNRRLSFLGGVSVSHYQVPDTAGLPAGTAPDGQPWVAGNFPSAQLDENQVERNGYGVATYQQSAGDLNLQASVFGRGSGVRFRPDPVGDLYFNGVASDVDRQLASGGFQGDGSYALGDRHTLRGGAMVVLESVSTAATTTVFPVDAAGDPTGPAFPLADRTQLHGSFSGAYLQDEWRLAPGLTVNGGARFDVFAASFDRESQLSPRLNLVGQPTAATTWHLGYARYFTPPPVEDVPEGTVAQFDGTSNASATDQDDPVRAERSDYFDAGVSHQLLPGWQAGIDGYYKRAKEQLDDGLFGQTLILSAFNYAQGVVDGLELTTSYTRGGFSTYANLAHSRALGRDWTSSQFLFDPQDLGYVQKHWIHLDHDQTLSGSFGAAYLAREGAERTRAYVDVIYGTGLRADATAADGSTIPNGGSVPPYAVLNVGVAQSFPLNPGCTLTLRLDAVNLADKSYELRDGSGVGVNAAQFGMRRGFFGNATLAF